jgi:two-component system cell cycle sensor histidine kinase/response regulator CckA
MAAEEGIGEAQSVHGLTPPVPAPRRPVTTAGSEPSDVRSAKDESAGDRDPFDASFARLHHLLTGTGSSQGTAEGLEELQELRATVNSIRERNRELEQQASEIELERRRYRELFDGVPDGYVITEEEGVIIEGNQMAGHLLGVPRRHLAGRCLADYIAAGDQGAFYTELARLRSRPAAESSTVELVLEGGDQPFPAELHGVVERYRRGAGHTVRWLVRDRRSDPVTARLQADEQQLRALLQTAPVAIVLWDAAGDLLYANDSARTLLDPDPSAMAIGQWLARAVPDEGPDLEEALRLLRSGADAVHLSQLLTDRFGKTHWLDHNIAVVRGLEGTTDGYVSTIFDLTAERLAKQELTSSIEFADAIFDTVGAVVLVIDPDGRLERCNRTSEEVTGFRSAELKGSLVTDTLIPADGRQAFERELALSTDRRVPRVFESEILTAGGGRRRISWSNTVLTDDDGSVRAILGTGLDVTEQQILESRLAQRARLESVGRVAAGLSHDFNNTLTVLQARIERISARHADDATTADVAAINRTVERTTRLISQLLSFSGTRRVDPEPMVVNTELERAASLMADLLGPGIDVALDLTPADTTIAMDPSRFDQIVTNLAINARDAMPTGGTLTFATTIDEVRQGATEGGRRISHLDDGRYVRIIVADTGVGIEARDLSRVFDPYFTTKPASQGTGLGLATTYGTVVQARGDIVAESRVGSGTSLTIRLPLLIPADGSEGDNRERPAFEPTDTAPDPSRADDRLADGDRTRAGQPATGRDETGKGARIGTELEGGELVLVVDDDEAVLAVLINQLSVGSSRRVVGATSAEDVLARPVDDPPDLVVTDIQLPGLDGLQLAGRLWRRHPGLPVVFITGADPADLPEVPAGVVVLIKPVRGEDLRATVDRHLHPLEQMQREQVQHEQMQHEQMQREQMQRGDHVTRDAAGESHEARGLGSRPRRCP